MSETIDAETVDEATGEVLPARQMRGEVLAHDQVSITTEQGLVAANELNKIVKARGWVSNIQGNDYLNVEGWTFLGSRFGLAASTETEFVKADNGDVVAVLARAKLKDRRTGDVIAEASQTCDLGGRFKELNHAMGMAQTRAISRVYQQQFRWIAKMAGYEGTPAEEMEGVVQRSEKPRGGGTPHPPPKSDAAPDEDPDWLDEKIGGGGKHAEDTWRHMTEGSYGGARQNYLDWIAFEAKRAREETKQRAMTCLAIIQKRHEEKSKAAEEHESTVPF